ncbi:MAG: hypothetical protein A3B07_02810 [Candidatus Yonathbacteria bacterium RIFCSPLOWO2_01_FULL_43_27]|uniref:Uncharacterized protein n=1 Tax=Candidatus Yonathbacteria bacterium RIFCSPLOWO2_01_FULL_43_27 TaxID=1802726 RepID=A0A1G2SBX6_9BACT|nr:MAG: hypothetical protein A3B07_02810 [Candidatus Yonathbacteria bacterium RIFCSPLOWO2_01_FULL_43_27]
MGTIKAVFTPGLAPGKCVHFTHTLTASERRGIIPLYYSITWTVHLLDFLFAITRNKISKGLAKLQVFASHLGSRMKKVTFLFHSLYVANNNIT